MSERGLGFGKAIGMWISSYDNQKNNLQLLCLYVNYVVTTFLVKLMSEVCSSDLSVKDFLLCVVYSQS